MNGLSSANAPSLDLPARFMALSMISLAIIAGSAIWTLPLMQGPFSDFSLLAFVHLCTLGFVGAMIIGASYQLVPVALQVPLSSARTGRISFWFYVAGLALFLIGLSTTHTPLIGIGGTLLAIAFLLYIAVITLTWIKTPERDVVAWHIGIGLLGAGAGMVLGFSLALNKSNGMLGSRLLEVLAGHITLMLGGWVAITFTGVAYRLIGMFTLSETHFVRWLAWAELVLCAGGSWLLAARFVFGLPPIVGQVAAVAILAGLISFAVHIAHLYRRRMRRALDIHVPFAVVAALSGIASAGVLAAGLFRHQGPNSSIWVAAVWLALMGTAGTAIQGFFYKIATFLVWLKRYAPVAGRERVPRLEELYNRRLAMAGWALWTTAVIAGAVTLVGNWQVLPWVGCVLLSALVCFLCNVALIARHWLGGFDPGKNGLLARHGTAQ
jgi:hypothetical protein